MKKQIVLWIPVLLMMCFIPIHTSLASTTDPSAKECTENDDLSGCNEGEEEDQEEGQGSSSPLNQSDDEESPSLVWNIVKLVLALGFIIILIYGLLKFVNRRNQMISNVRTMQNLGGISLGQQKSMQLVRIGDRYYVVGVGDNVELLTEITDEHTIKELSNTAEDEPLNPGARLASILSKNKNESPQESDSSIQFQQLFQSELKSLKEKREKVIEKQQQKKEDSDE